MTSLQFLSQLIEHYGLYAVFFLAMIEGDITLLLAGVLAHGAFFGEYSFLKVLCAGTAGGVAGGPGAVSPGGGVCLRRRGSKVFPLGPTRTARPARALW